MPSDGLEKRYDASRDKQLHIPQLTLSPPNKMSSAKFLVCFNFQNASMSLKVGENVV